MSAPAVDPRRSIKPLFSWRSRLCSPGGPADPVTRYVLLVLSLYMNELGESCFPSMDRLATNTGLAKTTIKKHLKLAVETGWIVRTLRAAKQQTGYSFYEYRASVGDVGRETPHSLDTRQENQRPSNKVGREMPPGSQVGHLTTQGGASDDTRGVARRPLLHQEYSKNTPSDEHALKRLLKTPDDQLNDVDRQWKAKYLASLAKTA